MTEQSYASGGETTTLTEGDSTMKQLQATTNAPQFTPQTSFSLSLPLTTNHGNGESGAMLVFRAISDYKRNVLRDLLQSNGSNDHASAIEDFYYLELLEDYSLELASAFERAATINYRAYRQAANPEEYTQSYQEWEEQDDTRHNEYFKTYSR